MRLAPLLRRVQLRVAVPIAAASLLLAGCDSISGQPVAGAGTASTAAGSAGAPTGMSTASTAPSDGPNGPIAGAPASTLTVQGDAHTVWDTQAKNTIDDLYTFYQGVFSAQFGQVFKPATTLISYDSKDKNAKACGASLFNVPNAGYVYGCDTIIWDRGVELPTLGQKIGDLAVPTVLAHEMGHLVQTRLGVPSSSPTILLEQQADCYAGAYWKWVADGKSKFYNINATTGIRQTLQTLAAVRDPVGSTPDVAGAHGDAFDRAYAETEGYTGGVARCGKIDMTEIDARISEKGFTSLPSDFGNIPITDDFLRQVADVANQFFGRQLKGYRAPKLTAFTGTTPPTCGGSPTTFPVGYCAATNMVTYNLVELVRIGTPTAGFDSTTGDFSAVMLLVSRMALADGTAGTGDAAGLRAVCSAGAWADWMKKPQGAKKLALSPVDLDNAEYEVMASPLPASDAAGHTSTQVIEQLQAMNTGVVSGVAKCASTYR